MIRVPNGVEQHVLSFVRERDGHRVFACFNLSDAERSVSFGVGPHHGVYVDTFSNEQVVITPESTLALPAWGYQVLVEHP